MELCPCLLLSRNVLSGAEREYRKSGPRTHPLMMEISSNFRGSLESHPRNGSPPHRAVAGREWLFGVHRKHSMSLAAGIGEPASAESSLRSKLQPSKCLSDWLTDFLKSSGLLKQIRGLRCLLAGLLAGLLGSAGMKRGLLEVSAGHRRAPQRREGDARERGRPPLGRAGENSGRGWIGSGTGSNLLQTNRRRPIRPKCD